MRDIGKHWVSVILLCFFLAGCRSTGIASGSNITAEAAQNIALQHAGLSANDVSYIWTEFEYDDGQPEYQVKFVSGAMEYDVEVNATNGNIISYDVDSIYD